VCCRIGHDQHLDACNNEGMSVLPRADQHVCRDPGPEYLTVLKDRNQPYDIGAEYNCWDDCIRQSGECRMCGPDPNQPSRSRVCCRTHYSNDDTSGECQKVGLNDAANELPPPMTFHACRNLHKEPTPAEPAPILHAYGNWEYLKQVWTAEEFSYGVVKGSEQGQSTTKEVSSEVSMAVEAGLAVGPSMSMSVTVGHSVSEEINEVESTEYSSDTTFTLDRHSPYDHVWQWRVRLDTEWQCSEFCDGGLWPKIEMRQGCHTRTADAEPACLPNHFLPDTYSGGQTCNFGYRLDGTGGNAGWVHRQCGGRYDVQPHQYGADDHFRGWYDVSGCGQAFDYCRWEQNSEGNPALLEVKDSWDSPLQGVGLQWKCLLSNGDEKSAFDLPGWSFRHAGTRPLVVESDTSPPVTVGVKTFRAGKLATILGANRATGCSTSVTWEAVCLEEARDAENQDEEFDICQEAMHRGPTVSEEDCLQAVIDLLPRPQTQTYSHLISGSWSDKPTGCSVDQEGWVAYYNFHARGLTKESDKRDSRHLLVCADLSAQPPTPPPPPPPPPVARRRRSYIPSYDDDPDDYLLIGMDSTVSHEKSVGEGWSRLHPSDWSPPTPPADELVVQSDWSCTPGAQSGHNQLGSFRGYTYDRCEQECGENPQCLSFDSSARDGGNECYLSTTTAATGGGLRATDANYLYCEKQAPSGDEAFEGAGSLASSADSPDPISAKFRQWSFRKCGGLHSPLTCNCVGNTAAQGCN